MHTIASQYASISRLGFGTFRMSGGGCQPVSRERSRSATAISVWHGQLATKESIHRAFATSIDKRRKASNLDAVKIRLDDKGSAAIALPKDRRSVTPFFASDWNAPTL